MFKKLNSPKYSNKNKLAAFLGMALLSFSALMSSEAKAKVSYKNINNISKNYKNNKQYFSLTLGQIALDNGMIHNLRFFGVEKPGVNKKNQRRWYVGDASSDPLVQLIIDLFPSPAGGLSTTVDIKETFGKYATVETIALLLKYTNEIRKNKEAWDSKKPQPFLKGSGHTPQERDARIDEIRKYETQYKKSAEALKIKFSKDIIQQNKKMNKKALNQVLSKVTESIEQEYNPQSLYPQHTTEQVINAFFCERFDNNDVWKLINVLDDDIVEHPLDGYGNRIYVQEPLLTTDKLNDIVGKDPKIPYDLDEIYALENAPTFFALTPYKQGTDPISNDSDVKAYNQKTIQAESDTFSDCEETTLRHILNLLFYNSDKKEFDLSVLDQLNLSGPLIDKLKDFYAKQTPDQANEGGELRDLWNEIVGDLNHVNLTFQSPEIEYSQETSTGAQFELIPNIINSIHVLQKIFQIQLLEMPTDDMDSKKEWIETSLVSIFKTLNNKRDYEVDISSLIDSPTETNQLTGSLKIQVLEEENALFSFDFNSDYQAHSSIENIVSESKDIDLTLYEKAIAQHKHNFSDQDTEQSLWTLGGVSFKDNITFPLYKLFHQKISDNNSKIEILKEINNQYDFLQRDIFSSKVSKKYFNTLLKNVLEGISWEDKPILHKALPVTMILQAKPELADATHKIMETLEQLESLDFFYAPTIEKIENWEKLVNLKTLNLRSTNLKKVSVKGLASLKELNFESSAIEKINDLDSLSNLENLNLGYTKNLKEISVQGLVNLKELNFVVSAIEKINDLDSLSNLENLNLGYTKNLKEISVQGLTNLKKLSVEKSSIEKIEGLDNLSNLENISLGKMTSLKEFSLKGLHKIKNLNFEESSIEQLDLDDFSELETLKFIKNTKLKQFSAKGLTKLEKLVLSSSPLEKLDVNGLTNLKTLSFTGAKNSLKEIFLKDLVNLKKISGFTKMGIVFRSPVEKIDIDGLLSLEELDLNKQVKLREFSLKGATNLNNISFLQHTSIEKIDLADISLKVLNLKATQNLKEVSFNGLCDTLEDLDLENSTLSNLRGLNLLTNLKKLNLKNAQNIQELEFSQENKELGLNLKGSGIRNRAQIKGIEYLDEDKIEW